MNRLAVAAVFEITISLLARRSVLLAEVYSIQEAIFSPGTPSLLLMKDFPHCGILDLCQYIETINIYMPLLAGLVRTTCWLTVRSSIQPPMARGVGPYNNCCRDAKIPKPLWVFTGQLSTSCFRHTGTVGVFVRRDSGGRWRVYSSVPWLFGSVSSDKFWRASLTSLAEHMHSSVRIDQNS